MDRVDDSAAVAPPAAADLMAIDSDAWAVVLRHARASLHDLDDDQVDAAVKRLRAAPTGRLAGGRTRAELSQLIGRGGPLWRDLHARLAASGAPDRLRWLVEGRPRPAVVVDGRDGDETPPAAAGERQTQRRLKQRARVLQQERDEARRQLDGERARVASLERALATVRAQLADAGDRREAAGRALAAVEDERAAAVDRERRRHAAELASLRVQLRAARGEADRLRRAGRRDAARRADDAPAPSPDDGIADDRPTGFVPGRPSRLPTSVAGGTRQEAEALLHRGRRVVVDGYNVTRQHRGDLDLDGQRRWLLQQLASAAAAWGLRPHVVWDGQLTSHGRRAGAPRGVAVTFTRQGVQADDDIEFAVAALPPDEPVVVVTDDRGVRDRVAAYGVDLLHTGPFLWALR